MHVRITLSVVLAVLLGSTLAAPSSFKIAHGEPTKNALSSSPNEEIDHAGRFLRAEDDEEERAFSSLKAKLSAQLEPIKARGELLKKDYKNVEAKIQAAKEEATILTLIRQGRSQDDILGRMGVKPSFVDSKGMKFYDPKDPGVKLYTNLLQKVEIRKQMAAAKST